MTLLDFLLALLGDSPEDLALQQDFADNPVATLQALDLGDLTAEDVHDALVLVQDNQTVEFGDTEYNTGGNTIVAAAAPAFPHHEAAPEGHSAIEYIQTYVTNTEVQDADTTIGSPVKQVIDAGDDVDQTITTTTTAATGDGAVAAGDDISDSQVVTGSGNIFGDGNVTGDGNTGSFGAGSEANVASISGTTVSQGSAISVGGTATGDYSVSDSGNTSTVTDTTTTEISDSYNSDTDVSFSYEQDDHSETVTNSGNVDHDNSHNTVDVSA